MEGTDDDTVVAAREAAATEREREIQDALAAAFNAQDNFLLRPLNEPLNIDYEVESPSTAGLKLIEAFLEALKEKERQLHELIEEVLRTFV